mgnify:CR=1 FL=1
MVGTSVRLIAWGDGVQLAEEHCSAVVQRCVAGASFDVDIGLQDRRTDAGVSLM